MIYKVTVRVTVKDEKGNKIVDLAEDKFINSDVLEALNLGGK